MHPVGLDRAKAPEHLAPVYAACQEQGVGLVAMKAYAGGMLLNRQHSQATPVQCLHYVLSQPVATAAVGVQSADEVRAALEYYTCPEEAREYGVASETLALHDWDACTQCLHCMPCPNGLDVPEIMRLAFMARWKLSPLAELRAEYATLQAKASDCEECRTCLERCAFGVDIMERMATAREGVGRVTREQLGCHLRWQPSVFRGRVGIRHDRPGAAEAWYAPPGRRSRAPSPLASAASSLLAREREHALGDGLVVPAQLLHQHLVGR